MPSLNIPTGATPGVPSSVLSASGISDAAFVNIGGEIRRESPGRTIAGSMRLGRFYGLKPMGEIQGMIDAATRAQLNQYVADLKTQGYSQINASTLERDIGGGYKEVVTIDWNTGKTMSQQALTEAAIQEARAQEREYKSAQKSYDKSLLFEALGPVEFWKNEAALTKDPSLKLQYLAKADKEATAAKIAAIPVLGYTSGGTPITATSPAIKSTTSTAYDTNATLNKLINTNIPGLNIQNLVSTSTAPSFTSGGGSGRGGGGGGAGGGTVSKVTSSPITATSPVIKVTPAPVVTAPAPSSYKSYMAPVSLPISKPTSAPTAPSVTGAVVSKVAAPSSSLGSTLGSALNKAVSAVKSIIGGKAKSDTKSKSRMMGYGIGYPSINRMYTPPHKHNRAMGYNPDPVSRLLNSEVPGLRRKRW